MSQFDEKDHSNQFNQAQRILVIGSPGAGKTYFSMQLAEKIKLPLYHLDNYYWLKDWQRLDADQWEKELLQLCRNKQWIIDGNHHPTFVNRLRYADYIIFLDYPVRVCAWRFLLRSIKRYFGKDSSLPINIRVDTHYRPRITIKWHLIKRIIFFKYTIRPQLLALAESYQCPVFAFKSSQHANLFLNQLSQTNH